MKKIYLVDVSSMFFRAFYAVRPLTSPAGMPVNAIYGFLSMITKILQDEKPEYMVFCYDRKEPSFRKDLYAEYKANRTEMPEDLGVQIPYIKQLADLLGIPSLEIPSYEADDIIGTLTHVGRNNHFEVIIVSGDKDFGQLIQDHVLLWDTMKDVKYDSNLVKEKWGVSPDQFIDYLAIVGDTSDNVPGVTGIGPKGAIKLIEKYGTLENIYEHIDEVDSKSIKEKLVTCKEQAFLSKKLVTIETQIPVDSNIESYHLKGFQNEDLRQFLIDLNFKSFEKKLLGETSSGIPSDESNPTVVHSVASQNMAISAENSNISSLNSESSHELKKVELEISEIKSISIEEIDSYIKPNSEIFGFMNENQAYLGLGNSLFEIKDSQIQDLGEWADDRLIRWKGFDLKSFWHLINAKMPLLESDIMLSAYALKTSDCTELKKVYKTFYFQDLPESISAIDLYKLLVSMNEDLNLKLESHGYSKILDQLEIPLVPVLYAMERIGIQIDKAFLKDMSIDLKNELSQKEQKIHALAGEIFNIASPKQLGVILFEKLGLPVGKKTKTGYSTDTDVLQGLEHPIAQEVLQYRELAKLKSTYVDSIPELTDTNGRVHTHFNQALTTTGRLSSTEPNLQNIPIRTERGRLIRKAFVAAPDMHLLSLDYSQIELRILAHISDDKALCRAFEEDHDIHTATAAEIYNKSLTEVTSDLRRAAKAVNFGIAYGQGAFGLAENLGIGRKEAQEIIERYFQKFPGVRNYIESTVKLAHEKGYVETLFGRRRYIDELQSKNQMIRKFGERAAINAPIQGTASDLVKKAMIEIFQRVDLPLLLQVHDELIFEGTKEKLETEVQFLKKIMESAMTLKVPLKVNFAIGKNWDEAH